MRHPTSKPPLLVLQGLLVFGCGGAIEPESASSVDGVGGALPSVDAIASASGGSNATTYVMTDATAGNSAAEVTVSLEPRPVLDNCAETVTSCLESTDGSAETAWRNTIASIAIECGVWCIWLELATTGNCITEVTFPFYVDLVEPGRTKQGVMTCVSDRLLAQRWDCVPVDTWSRVEWYPACVLM